MNKVDVTGSGVMVAVISSVMVLVAVLVTKICVEVKIKLVEMVVVVTALAVMVIVARDVVVSLNTLVEVERVLVTREIKLARARIAGLEWEDLPVVDGVVVDEIDEVTVFEAERVIVNHMRVMVMLVLVVDGVAVSTMVRLF